MTHYDHSRLATHVGDKAGINFLKLNITFVDGETQSERSEEQTFDKCGEKRSNSSFDR